MYSDENKQRPITKEELEVLWNYQPAEPELTPYKRFCFHWIAWAPQVGLTLSQQKLVKEFMSNEQQYKDLSRAEIEKYFGYVRPEALTDEVHDAIEWKWWSYVIVTVPGLRALAARLTKEWREEPFKFKRRPKNA